MAEFKGANNKVRCLDCSQFSGLRCNLKEIKVASKKRRICSLYQFKGEYENRTPLESTYVPKVDKTTRKLLNKLLKLGVVSPSRYDNLQIPDQGSFSFRSTATAGLAEVNAPEEKDSSSSMSEEVARDSST